MQGSLVNKPCVAGGDDWVMIECTSLRCAQQAASADGYIGCFQAFCQPRSPLNSSQDAFFAAICFNVQENRPNGLAETFFVIKIAIGRLA
jgi:hypothetical protein